ncbi:MAG: OmpH family outer membrane protein [Acidobacteriaceae bacterium]|nr:OmpH family outer membrane protein [Acidobacteriaceae bacterium]MBV9767739.1 OmpH family outer membrane protein [Acidobacteriaceae bacterium]
MVMRSVLLSATALACLAFGAYAQQPTKIGVISVQNAIVGTKDGQKASAELETKVAPKKKEFDTRQAEIAQLQDQYNKGGNLMSDDARNQLARQIDEKKKRLERDVQDAQEEMQAEQQRLLQGLSQRVMAVIEKYAKDNGFTMILDDSNPNTPVLWASTAVDITQDIISLYDKNSVNGAPASAPGLPGTAAPKSPGTPGPAAAVKPSASR